MKGKHSRPELHIVAPDERAAVPYQVMHLGKGITPAELYRRERELPLTPLHMYEEYLKYCGVAAAVKFLEDGYQYGAFTRHRTRSGGFVYGLPIWCLRPGIEEYILNKLLEIGTKEFGITKRELMKRIKDKQRVCPGCQCLLNLVCERRVARDMGW